MINNDNKILLFAHGGSLNRGCDALLRTISKCLKDNLNNTYITVASNNPAEDEQAYQKDVDRYIVSNKYTSKIHPLKIIAIILNRVFKSKLAYKIYNGQVIKSGRVADIAISIGGDNYFKGYKMYPMLYTIDKEINKAGKKLILWGCSIEPNEIDDEMEKDLKLFDLIIARESITYKALLEHGISKNTILCPDPAFTMKSESLELPEGWLEGNTIGLNISPLVIRLEKSPGIVINATKKLIEYIIKYTESNVALIPHVTWVTNNDLGPLKQLYEIFKDSKRVILIGEGFNAPQLKGFISRCRMFIGARTHATIAAYSTCVPTLVLGYSVKARGIVKDVFDNENDLVLSIPKMSDEKQLIKAFEGLHEREEDLRFHLQNIMPGYIESARQAVKHIQKLIEE